MVMLIHELKRSSGYNKPGKRLGRGDGSKGNYSGRGLKGQKARSGGNIPAYFEGGQTPLHRRLPKLRGFKRYFKLVKKFAPINISRLEADARIASGATVDKNLLKENGYIKNTDTAVKILGGGELTKSLKFVGVEATSAKALEAIEKAGGSVDLATRLQLQQHSSSNPVPRPCVSRVF